MNSGSSRAAAWPRSRWGRRRRSQPERLSLSRVEQSEQNDNSAGQGHRRQLPEQQRIALEKGRGPRAEVGRVGVPELEGEFGQILVALIGIGMQRLSQGSIDPDRDCPIIVAGRTVSQLPRI